MYTRIGTDPTGTDVVVDTSIEEGRIALVAGVGEGKTTTCRFLARCWAARDSEHCVVLTPRVHGIRRSAPRQRPHPVQP